MKVFLDIEQQIELLESRGIDFSDKVKAYNFLLRKNYYNTANVYGKYFLIQKGIDKFKPGTDFDDICAMYDFEKRLRDHMFNVLMTVEANVSSTISHLFSKKFPSENSYLNIENYCHSCNKSNLSNWSFLQSRFSKIHTDAEKENKRNKNSIIHHLENHNSVPLWVIINNLTFGNVATLYRIIDTDLKREIAESFEELLTISYGYKVHLKPSEMQEYLHTLSNLRNKVTHDSCLSVYRNHRGKHVTLNPLNSGEYPDKNASRTKFYDVMLVSRFFISKNAHYSFIDNVLNEIKFLEKRIKDSTVLPQLMDDLGFNFYV